MKKILLVIFSFLLCTSMAFSQERENVLIILDCSYSMEETIHDQRKIDIAKNVINTILSQIPQNVSLGLRVYGHKRDKIKGFLGIDKCEVSELMVPVGSNNRHLITQSLNQLEPVGWTPICYSLEQAVAGDFATMPGKKRIILVSDGMETCSGNPCELAVEMVRENSDISIDVIGFDVSSDPSIISNLRCVALATHGKFYIADNPEEFLKSLQESFRVSQEVEGTILKK